MRQSSDYQNVLFWFTVPALRWPGVRLVAAVNDFGLPAYRLSLKEARLVLPLLWVLAGAAFNHALSVAARFRE